MSGQKPSKLRIEHLVKLEPLTANQGKAFESYKEGQNLVLSGCAGTGSPICLSFS